MRKSIRPPQTIGILGGGQLGRMLALKAREMGYQIVTLDPTPQSPCGQVADKQIVSDYNSLSGAGQLAACSDVVTYEFENISADLALELESHSYLPQGYQLLYTTQNRLREKVAIQQAGIAVAPYRQVLNSQELLRAVEELGLPVVLKTAEGGYDGKGQFVLKTSMQLDQALAIVQDITQQWVVEKFIPFAKELSVIVARNIAGEIEAFPVGENIHQQNILHLTLVPARVDEILAKRAQEIAIQLAQKFSLVGLLAVELFLTQDGDLLVNELAPRPHNSGHYTRQACETCQFEQHIRAICNLPLAKPKILHPTIMVNVLGKHLPEVTAAVSGWDSDWKLHVYGKAEGKPLRKMGHVNILTDNMDKTLVAIRKTGIWEMEGIE